MIKIKYVLIQFNVLLSNINFKFVGNLARTKEVSLMLGPGHCGIEGKEETNDLTRDGANQPC